MPDERSGYQPDCGPLDMSQRVKLCDSCLDHVAITRVNEPIEGAPTEEGWKTFTRNPLNGWLMKADLCDACSSLMYSALAGLGCFDYMDATANSHGQS